MITIVENYGSSLLSDLSIYYIIYFPSRFYKATFISLCASVGGALRRFGELGSADVRNDALRVSRVSNEVKSLTSLKPFEQQ